jgi:hypothetical protein
LTIASISWLNKQLENIEQEIKERANKNEELKAKAKVISLSKICWGFSKNSPNRCPYAFGF